MEQYKEKGINMSLEETKESITKEILTHTNKLERHLAILPEKLIEELQQQYLEYTEKNPLIIEGTI